MLATAANLVNALHVQGQHTEADEMNSETLKVQKRVLGQEHPDTLMMDMNIASALRFQGQHAAAAAMCRKMLEVQKRVLVRSTPAR